MQKKYFYLFVAIILFIFGYWLIQDMDGFELLGKLNQENVGYGLIFLIGVLASFHCIGMCGGLVVTYTAKQQTSCISSVSHWQYNLGRLVSYTVIGGILGGFGSFFGINPTFTGTITIIAGGFMVLMGLSLLTNFKWFKKIQIRTPKAIAKYLYSNSEKKKPKTPLIIGLLNGFMPCGPLQAMQLYALATGSITQGALTMALYAAGTIPLMFGFGNMLSSIKKERIAQIMKISGLIVIILGAFMFNRGLTNFGYGFKSLLAQNQNSQSEISTTGEYQEVLMDLTYNGYEPSILYVQKGIPVRWVINVKQMTGCTDAIMIHDYDIEKNLVKGENIIEFTPKEAGEIKFSCWMEMVWGKFIVTEGPVAETDKQTVVADLPASTCSGDGSCGGTCGTGSCGCGN